jgi:hypothetical protein
MTLKQWLAENSVSTARVGSSGEPGDVAGCFVVIDNGGPADFAGLFHLTDWVVSSRCSGPSYWLVPRSR